MAMKKVLITTTKFHGDAEERLSKAADLILVSPDHEEIIKKVRDVDAAIVGAGIFDEEVFESANKLKIVSKFGVGYDNIDVEAASRRGIYVTIAPTPELITAVAEFALGLILSLAKLIPPANEYLKGEGYSRMRRWDHILRICEERSQPMMNLRGRTVGIVGLGRIGSELALKCKCLGMKVLYYDVVRKRSMEERYGVEYVDLDDLLRRSDFVSLNVPLTKKTRGLIGRRELALMKPSAYLINTSRGKVVDQKALYEALKDRRIAGAALDVFEEEPIPPEDPILKLDNVIVTPHIAAASAESIRSVSLTVCEDIMKVLEGKKPNINHLVNPEVLERH